MNLRSEAISSRVSAVPAADAPCRSGSSDSGNWLLRARHEVRANQLPESLDPDQHEATAVGTKLTRELIAVERKYIHVMLRDGKITDEIRRRIERDLDLEEASLANREYRALPG